VFTLCPCRIVCLANFLDMTGCMRYRRSRSKSAHPFSPPFHLVRYDAAVRGRVSRSHVTPCLTPFRANQDVMILGVVTRHTTRKIYDPTNSTPPTHLFTSNALFHLQLLQAATPRDRRRSVNPAVRASAPITIISNPTSAEPFCPIFARRSHPVVSSALQINPAMPDN
jgi:hypothetical protein